MKYLQNNVDNNYILYNILTNNVMCVCEIEIPNNLLYKLYYCLYKEIEFKIYINGLRS